ncbi:fungal-specific transcription factor domain-containing protein [Coniochaeta sp. 2T2.1]|nr:fungal-specific transcription factor domain-containing protein [Coniochaeta sp. 2T2.1]
MDSAEPSPNAESPPPPTTNFNTSFEPGTAATSDSQSFTSIPTPVGASVYPPSAAVAPSLNPRSCVTCRRRKVRCDKHMPCGNCRRAKISCIFPAPGRAPRRPRPKDPNAPPKQHSSEREVELVKRLRKLEGIVEELSGQIELEAVRHSSADGHSPEATADGDRHPPARADSTHGSSSHGKGSPAASAGSRKESSSTLARTGSGNPNSPFGGLERSPTEINKNFGRLVLNDKGTSRYVSSGFWSKINDELNEMRAATQDIADTDTDDSDDGSTPHSMDEQYLDHQSFIMGYRSADVDLGPLHPLPSLIPFMWQIYQENVDPVLKILHVPTVEQIIRDRRSGSGEISPSTEALLFSIYYAAVTSMEAEDVTRSLGQDKSVLLNQYRFAVEQALAKANFITDPDVTVCQAFVIFLVLVRRHDKARFSWTLTGLAVRICQAIGIHRDGTNFPHLKPFEVEMRRRVFWSLLMLDLRAAEDQGTECILSDGSFDTQFPLNINDRDIAPDSTDFPPNREGPTDITFCLIRFEICNLARKMHVASTTVPTNMTRDETLRLLQERENMLMDVYKDLETKYLRDSSAESNPMYWVAGNIARVIVAKMITVIYQPILFALPVDTLSCRLRERLFLAAVEIFEYNHILNTDPRCQQWRWLFQTYTQWHAVAYLLLELCNRTWSATSERAWAAINACFTGPHSLALEKMSVHTAIWLPFKKLYHRAKKHRDAEIIRLRADPAAAEQCDRMNRARDPPSSFGALSNSIKCSIAQDRWRKLVNLPPTPPPLPSIEGQNPCSRYEEVNTVPQTQPTPPEPSDLNMQYTDQLDDIVQAAISDPQFNPYQIMPLAFGRRGQDVGGRGEHMALARDITFGFSSVPENIPSHDHGIAPPSSTSTSIPHHQQQQGSAPASVLDDNPPVWLWNQEEVHKVNRNSGTPAGGGSEHDSGDVNMDEGLEGFDWQNWQENAGRFEVEANGGGNAGINGVWGVWYGI